eukprot:GCRY01004664.1.p1 GENE.GCRY01004664.1~~GCRY01004664.1.p1  ORF type:complete len:490 (-),score=66.29 GCRY01004664.1:372-1841(-)
MSIIVVFPFCFVILRSCMNNINLSNMRKGNSGKKQRRGGWLEVGVGCTVKGLQGVVQYIGPMLDKADDELWVGVELELQKGKNNGTVKGVSYFYTSARRGIFVKPNEVYGTKANDKYLLQLRYEPSSYRFSGDVLDGHDGSVTVATAHREKRELSTEALQIHLKGVHTNVLSVLDLSGSLVGIEGCRMVAEALAANTSLTKLALRENEIRDSGLKILAASFPTSLSSLDLSYNSIGPGGVRYLARRLSATNPPKSSQISFDETCNNATGFEDSFMGTASISKYPPRDAITQLVDLDLSFNPLGPTGVMDLARALSHTGIQSLSLSTVLCDDDAGRALAEMLPTTSVLLRLDISCNHLSDPALVPLAKAFVAHPLLSLLDFRGMVLSSKATKFLASLFSKNQTQDFRVIKSPTLFQEAARSVLAVLQDTGLEPQVLSISGFLRHVLANARPCFVCGSLCIEYHLHALCLMPACFRREPLCSSRCVHSLSP